ncbi:helix-turn-helix domain-containing protein [Pelagibacterium luteolum]|uniref:Helix-turn-helix n=1 Tax=Pelagibacterium luteolum TaxID=440168 RepID=A0A1G7ZGM2_9HYPH|nr:helix-turn-helix domain-containing protein [Pelagibacterium luteolum]SDH07834.1 Helix-turn-helix [Pelagibacterium luteolum]
MTPAQCRAARALIDWSQRRLADESGIGNATIRNFEAGRSTLQFATNNLLVKTFEAAGVQFLDPDDTATGPGVALKA